MTDFKKPQKMLEIKGLTFETMIIFFSVTAVEAILGWAYTPSLQNTFFLITEQDMLEAFLFFLNSPKKPCMESVCSP